MLLPETKQVRGQLGDGWRTEAQVRGRPRAQRSEERSKLRHRVRFSLSADPLRLCARRPVADRNRAVSCAHRVRATQGAMARPKHPLLSSPIAVAGVDLGGSVFFRFGR